MICRGQLIDGLVSLLRGTQVDIDEVVREVKDRLVQEVAEAKREDLGRLFDSQIQTLKDRGCPEQIVEMLQAKRDSVLQKAGGMSFNKGDVPFIPVVPRTYRSSYDLMAMVRSGDKHGRAYLYPTAITDESDTPKDPYYIYDIEDGRATLGKTPNKAGEIIKKQGRHRHTVAEDISLATHTAVLSHHNLFSTGSRYGRSDEVPNVYLDNGDQPRLEWFSVDYSFDPWGSASCGSR